MNNNFKEINDISFAEINGGMFEKIGEFIGNSVKNSMIKSGRRAMNRPRAVWIKRKSPICKKYYRK
ncbi:hypothetical protein R3379_36815 [Bacillus sp. BAU-SS-2023]|nr:hypothetical protein [Bacillus sp. BAU-SS-2023]